MFQIYKLLKKDLNKFKKWEYNYMVFIFIVEVRYKDHPLLEKYKNILIIKGC